MLTLSILPEEFGICRLESSAGIPAWATVGPFFSITKTTEELSIVCPSALIPQGTTFEREWRCLKVHGPLPFDQTGVLSSLAEPLAKAGVSIFALSTYDTDYLLVKDDDLSRTIKVLLLAGNKVNEQG